MVNNRFLLGFVAFGTSFGITLLTSRDPGRAFITGVTTLPAVYIASGIVNRRSYLQADNRLMTLRYHIQALQQRRVEAYEDFTEMLAEKERVALALNSLQMQVQQLQLSGSVRVTSKTALSWDLTAPEAAIASQFPEGVIAPQREALQPANLLPHELPTEIQPPKRQSGKLGRYLSEAEATRRKLESSLNTLQAELAQTKVEITEHRQLRDQVVQEITHLQEQKHQLEAESASLKDEVRTLEQCREELEQFLSYTEAKKRELESGSHPLQTALKDLQLQIVSLHEELRSLEAQVSDRRTQKNTQEHSLPEVNQPAQPGATSAQIASSSKSRSKAGIASSSVSRAIDTPTSEAATNRAAFVKPGLGTPSGASHGTIALPEFPRPDLFKSEKASHDLPSDWTEFMLQLPDYEMQVLKAIAEQANPAATLKRIAEENLTMPELLIDSINERALEALGDLVIESKAGASSATIAREHQKTVKKLVKVYEYLVK